MPFLGYIKLIGYVPKWYIYICIYIIALLNESLYFSGRPFHEHNIVTNRKRLGVSIPDIHGLIG